MATGGGDNEASFDHGRATDGHQKKDAWRDNRHGGMRSSSGYSLSDNDDDPHSEMRLDRPCSVRFQFPSRPSRSSSSSSSSSSNSHSRSSSSTSTSSSSQDSQSSGSRSSSISLSDSSSTSDSDSEPSSALPTRSMSQSPRQDFDAKSWFEKDMMQMKPDLTHFRNARPPILYYRWNAKICRDQFRRLKSNDSSDNKRRRLLNVTVMATTDRAIVKGRYTVDSQRVELNFPSRMTTILYEHRLKSPRDPATRTLFQSTTVNVVNEDCLIVCEQLMRKVYYPVLLNMANPSKPGGGFRRGASAQEEDLFRRSNYSRSLDIDFYETAEKTNNRVCCASTGECKPYRTNQSMYPLRNFDAIYTSGLCVFRYDEDHGYDFMDEPLYDVSAIAIAAPQDPPVENGQLPSDIADIMRKKVETIFAIAQDNHHDALVLSAFGCGAFHNPSEHVATIFKSVIEQYAGVFRRIDFAITGSPSNPKGNYSIFKKVLDGLILQAPKGVDNDCNNHRMQEDQNLSRHNEQRTPCTYGVDCRLQYSDRNSTQHNAKHTHPCRYSELCTNQDKEPHRTHEHHATHLCRYGSVCQDLVDPMHRAKYRHQKWPDFLVPCTFQQHCHDKTWGHRIKYSHGELTKKDRHHRTSGSKFEHSASKPLGTSDYTTRKSDLERDKRSSQHSYPKTKVRSANGGASHSSGSRHHENGSHHHHHASVSSHHSNSRRSKDFITRTNEGRDHYRKHHPEKKVNDSTHLDKVASSSRQNRYSSPVEKRQHRTPCKYGRQCVHIEDDHHRSKYSH